MNLFRYTNIIKNTKRTGNSDKMIASRRKQHQPRKTKKGYPHGQPIFIVNLKSNTMKNTVQIYELYVM